MSYLKRYVKGFYMSLGMFWGIPLPFYIWEEKYTAIMMASFPLVGLLIGSIWWLVAVLLLALSLPLILVAAFLTVTPFLVAGFIHLDGYMDTSDALLSRRPLADRLKILVDSRVGAFAVIMLGILFLLQFAAMYTVVEGGEYLVLVVVISILSRCCSAFSLFTLRAIPECIYTPQLKQNVGKSHIVFVVLVAIITVAFSVWYAGVLGVIVSAGVLMGYGIAIARTYWGFKGIAGDLLGYSLVISELCGLMIFAVSQGRMFG